MRRVFADSFFYIAVLNRKDAAHGRAVAFATTQAVEIVTTAAVLFEVADAMAAPMHRTVCGAFFSDLPGRADTRVLQISEGLFERGLALYRKRPDKAWSLTDCVSFAVMTEERLMDALTGDRHFEQAGFRALLAD